MSKLWWSVMTSYLKPVSAKQLNFGFICSEVLEPSSDVLRMYITELIQYYNSFIWTYPHL